MLSNYFENKLKDVNISSSERKTLKVIYTVFCFFIAYIFICKLAYGVGFLLAKLSTIVT